MSHHMQTHIESYLSERRWARKCHISIRTMYASKKSFQVSPFVQNLFQLSSPVIECNCKTIFMFERFGNCDVIIFAMFVQEYGDDEQEVPVAGNRRRIFVSNFGAPGFLQGINDDLHSELFCQFILSYLNYASSMGFEQVYFSSKMMEVAKGETNEEPIFNAKNVIKFRNEWLMSIFKDVDPQQHQMAYIGNFTTLADFRHFCRFNNTNEAHFPLFIFDEDDGDEKWSIKIEKSACDLLRQHRDHWINLDKSASRDIKTRTMADVLMYDLLKHHRFIVVNLQSPDFLTRKLQSWRGSRRGNVRIMDDDLAKLGQHRQLLFLSNSRLFLRKCQTRNWRFDTVEEATISTATIVQKIAKRFED